MKISTYIRFMEIHRAIETRYDIVNNKVKKFYVKDAVDINNKISKFGIDTGIRIYFLNRTFISVRNKSAKDILSYGFIFDDTELIVEAVNEYIKKYE